MHSTFLFATLLLSLGFVSAQCPRHFDLKPAVDDNWKDECVCVDERNPNITIKPDFRCIISLDHDKCTAICPSHTPSPSSRAVKRRQQQILNEDGTIANCPAKTISCPIDATMNMGYECISPHEDLYNCGGCVALGQGVDCESVAGVKRTECSHGRCINHSCRTGWVLDRESNNCIPRPRRNAY